MVITDKIIVDENMQSEAETLQRIAHNLESAIGRFYSILHTTHTNAIMSGDTKETVAAFAEVILQFNNKLEMFGNASRLTIETFVDEIDRADKYLY